MPKFLVEANYTATGTSGLLEEGGSSRRAQIDDVCAQLGGKLEAVYYAFGDYNLYCILDFPDNVSMAAVQLTVQASGAVDTKTVVLLTPEEIDAAAKKSVKFRIPGD
jgi:uncharacterized protein with GYD domain